MAKLSCISHIWSDSLLGEGEDILVHGRVNCAVILKFLDLDFDFVRSHLPSALSNNAVLIDKLHVVFGHQSAHDLHEVDL